jgi:uncharacterized membrane protein YhaH (DUF805 family)
MSVSRAFKIWFFTNLLGTVLLLFVSGENGTLNPEFFLILIAGGIVSLSALVLSAVNIRILKKLPHDPGLRTAYVVGSTCLIILAVLLLIMIVTGKIFDAVEFLQDVIELLYPYCIMALITTLYFTRDLILPHNEKGTLRLKEITDEQN